MRDVFSLFSFLLRFSGEVRHSRLVLVVITLAGIAGGFASTGLIALTASILNSTGKPTSALVWAFIGLCVALPVCRFFSQVLLVTLAQKTLLALRIRLSGRILAAPLRQLETIGASRLLATLTSDMGLIIDSMVMVPTLCMNLAIVVSCLAYLGWLSGTLLGQVALFIVLGVVTYQLPLLKALEHFRRSRLRLDEVFGQIRAMTEGAKELKMHRARRSAFLDAVGTSTDLYQVENRKGTILLAAGSSWGQVLFFVVLGLLVLLIPEIQSVDKKVLISYTIVLFQILAPLEVVLTTLPMLSRASIAAKTVESLGLTLEAEASALRSSVPKPEWERLELVGVQHKYSRENEDESFQLGPLDITFEPGEVVFLVGGNGSGKTTLAKILVGLYAPEAGEIRLGGRTVRAEDLEDYREHFSVVFSDFFLFEQLLGLASLDEQAREYLQRLKLDRKVRIQDGVLSTLDLSQGQRKRLALLTAYLEDRPIYLFDEWAADQDPVFKEIFYSELLPELKARGKTVFVISHDDHYFHVADRILKLENGRIDLDLSSQGSCGSADVLAARPASQVIPAISHVSPDAVHLTTSTRI